ncbi:MAG: dihydrofolate reductase [Planctomycetota bacterium]
MPDQNGNEIVMIAAVALNNAIGRDGRLPWRLREDLRHFQRTTKGHACIMGRRSFEERNEPLKNRRNIVITSRESYERPGIEVVRSLQEGIDLASTSDGPTFILGGTRVFLEAIPLADRFERTLVLAEPEADTFFPAFDTADWLLTAEREVRSDQENDHPYKVQSWGRVTAATTVEKRD